ncbi:hypothetical protein VTK56DRAFT_3217 [Thermocarpiscus australiensis]
MWRFGGALAEKVLKLSEKDEAKAFVCQMLGFSKSLRKVLLCSRLRFSWFILSLNKGRCLSDVWASAGEALACRWRRRSGADHSRGFGADPLYSTALSRTWDELEYILLRIVEALLNTMQFIHFQKRFGPDKNVSFLCTMEVQDKSWECP